MDDPQTPNRLLRDAAIIDAYIAKNPHDLPANNTELRAAVNDPTYVDRGMWGPYGGKNGTVSQVWLDEYRAQTKT